MDENQFLNSYKKKLSEQEKPAASAALVETKPEQTALRYEDQSDFVPPRPIDGVRTPAGQRRPAWVPAAVVGLVILLLAAFLIWLFSRGVEVIDLTNWTTNDAQLWAGDRNIKLQVTEAYNDTFAAGRIIRQNPQAGVMLEKGGFLQVTVSLGHDLSVTLPLPDLLTMTMAEVEAWAEENFMTRVRITTEFHDEIEAGRVIRFEVNDDTVVDQVRRNSPVYVIVSRGPQQQTDEKVTIPNFREMTLLQSQQFATNNHLVLVVVEQYDDFVPAGSIMEQSVAAEEEVSQGTEIILTVSRGKKTLVPGFSAYTRERAAMIAAELGISLTMNERYSSRSAGQFISQSLSAGTIYVPGDVLELTYSLGNQIILPSFIGQTRTAVESWVADLNEKGASIRISVTQTQNNAPRDTIIYQDKTNVVIGTGTTVRITVSLGRMVFVPDLIAPEGSVYGQAVTREMALAQCEALGLIPIFVAEQKTGRLPGEIWHQSVAPGKEVYQETTITLKYNPVNVTLAIPDFRGMTEKAIIEAGYLKKLTITFIYNDEPTADSSEQVTDQSLPVGETVAAGTAITLRLSPAAPKTAPFPSEESEPTPLITPANAPTGDA